MLPEKLIITYLEMKAAPQGPPKTAREGVEVRQVASVTPDFYRFLYNGVGRDWHWTDRARLGDEELRQLLHAPGVEVWVLYVGGAPAGYVEYEFSDIEAKIAYFGLLPDFIGQGLGGYFLNWAVHQAWRSGISRLWLHTCNLDHPAALSNYQRAGFTTFRTSELENHHRQRAELAHISLVAHDWRALADFYVEALGCTQLQRIPQLKEDDLNSGLRGHGLQPPPQLRLEGVRLRLPAPHSLTLEIGSYTPESISTPDHPATPGWRHLAFKVADLEAVAAQIVRCGGRVLGEAVETPVSQGHITRWQYLRDPEGNLIEVYATSALEGA